MAVAPVTHTLVVNAMPTVLFHFARPEFCVPSATVSDYVDLATNTKQPRHP